MASTYKRKDGSWCCKFQLLETGNKWHYCYAGKKGELKEAQRLKTEKILAQLDKEKNANNPTLDEYYERWYEKRKKAKSVKETTLYHEGVQYKNHISPALGQMRLKNIRKKDCINFQNGLIARMNEGRMAPRTINSICGILHKILKSAMNDLDENDEGIIEFNPADAIQKVKEKTVNPDNHRALKNDVRNDLDVFLDEAAKNEFHYLNLCKFALYTGCRIGECCAVKIGAVDFENGILHVCGTTTRDEYGSLIIGTPKNGTSNRYIPLSKQALEVCREQIQKRREFQGLTINERNELLFYSPNFKLIDGGEVEKRIGKQCDKAGIQRFGTHSFRKTFINRLVEVNCPDRVIKQLIGHAQSDTLGRHYLEESMTLKREWIEKAFADKEVNESVI